MKLLNNYILERLNPRNLGPTYKYDFSTYFKVPGKLSWRSLDSVFGDYDVECKDWYCMVTEMSSYTYLLFYSENSEYMFYINTQNIEHNPSWWGRVEYDKEVFKKPEHVYIELSHNFHTYTMVSKGAESIEKTIYSKEVGCILDAYKEQMD